MQGFTTVPFKTESAHGLSQVNGIAKFSAAGIVLEFESKLFGVLDIKFRKGLFKRSAKITIRTKTFAKLAELPNNDGKLTLKLERDDLERGQAAVEQLQKDLAAYEAALPPPSSPVSGLFIDDAEDETAQLKKEK
jgi:hypothetical protein